MTDLNSIFETAPLTNAPSGPLPSTPPSDTPRKRGRKPNAAKVGRKGQGKGATRGPRRTPVASSASGGQAQAMPAPVTPPKTGKKRGRKPGSPARLPGGATTGIKLDLTTMMGALVGLKARDADLVGKITQALGTINKKSRQRVLEAVGRIFT